MYRFLILFLFTGGIFAQNWQLVWSDEFDSTSIDFSNWTRETGGHGWGNNELQYYTDRDVNSYIENGHLVIKAMKESFGGNQYTSARLKTQGKKFFKYGKIEASIKLPYGKGIWPAFWMLGESFSTVGWPACGEIDIMELVGGGDGDRTVHGTAHWDDNGHAQYGGSYSLLSGRFADSYHKFTIVWDPEKIVWYVDNLQYHSIDITPPSLSEFHDDFFIILNVAVGGSWPGFPDASTVFPQTMEVDYVRVYENVVSVPQVTLSYPDNVNYEPGANIPFTADATVESGSIRRVDFFQDNALIGSTDVFPYEFMWRNIEAGCYSISATAISDAGFEGSSNVINVTVGSGCPQAPYLGYLHSIPGKIEAEDYDIGGINEAFYDSDAGNTGGQYRNEDVDIEECSDDGGGYDVGWITTGEWLEYSVNVKKTSNYDFQFRVASTFTMGKINIYVDDQLVASNIQVSSTGDWQNWDDIFAENINLSEGRHTVKLEFAAGLFNLNYFRIYESGTSPSITLISPNGGETYGSNSVQEIIWEADRVDNVKIGLSTNGGTSWSFVSQGTQAKLMSHRWLVPEANSDNCMIMILDAKNLSVSDVNDAPFSITTSVSVKKDENLPSEFKLEQNYPNPFNPTTVIRYSLPDNNSAGTGAQDVSLVVYDLFGREVAVLVSGKQSAGLHEVHFNAEGLSSGIYLYKLSYNGKTIGKKMLLLK